MRKRIVKKEAVTSNLSQNIEHDTTKHIRILNALQDLREIAWLQAIKYRFDPVLGRTHEEYLQALNGLLKEVTP